MGASAYIYPVTLLDDLHDTWPLASEMAWALENAVPPKWRRVSANTNSLHTNLGSTSGLSYRTYQNSSI